MNTTLFKNYPLSSLLDDFNYFNFGTLGSSNLPQANIQTTDKETIISIAVPGFKKEDIKIEIENFSIIVSSSIKKEETYNENFFHKEFCISNFFRKFKISDQSNIEQITSSLENGILTIKIPKSQKNIKLIDIQ